MLKRFQHRTLRSTLIGMILILLVPMILVAGFFTATRIYSMTLENIDVRTREATQSYRLVVQRSIELYTQQIEIMAKDMALRGSSSNNVETREMMLDQYVQASDFTRIMYVDMDGLTSDGIDLTGQEYFYYVLSGRTWMTSPIVSPTTGQVVITVATPIYDLTNNVKGMLVGYIDAATFCSVVDNINFGKSGFGLLVDEYGQVVAHPDRQIVLGMTNYMDIGNSNPAEYGEMARVMRCIVNSEETGITDLFRFQGKDYIISYAPIDNNAGWMMGVAAVPDEFLGTYRSAIATISVMMLVFVAIGVIFALVRSRQIAMPIRNQANRLQMLAKGDVHSPVPTTEMRHEVGTLAGAMDESVHSLQSYITEISRCLELLAQGDFTFALNSDFRGDFSPIRNAMELILEQMNETMATIQVAAHQLNSTANQVSQASTDLAKASAEQTIEVESLSNIIDQMVKMQKLTSDLTEKAIDVTRSSETDLQSGVTKMTTLAASMRDIDMAASEISKIIKMIEDIAFQTNLLALNAAVEAARAGQHGKGFAVVADEVRNLASLSAGAADQTTDLITRTVEAIHQGVEIADETAAHIQKVSENSQAMVKDIAVIHQGAVDEAIVVDEITRSIQTITSTIQSNSATSENTAASSEELSSQAQALTDLLQCFIIKEDSATSRYNLASNSPDNTSSPIWESPAHETYKAADSFALLP